MADAHVLEDSDILARCTYGEHVVAVVEKCLQLWEQEVSMA